MHTIKLRVNNSAYKHLMWFLGRFKSDEIEVVSESETFKKNKEYLHKELQKLENEESEFLSLEELNEDLEKVISENEN